MRWGGFSESFCSISKIEKHLRYSAAVNDDMALSVALENSGRRFRIGCGRPRDGVLNFELNLKWTLLVGDRRIAPPHHCLSKR